VSECGLVVCSSSTLSTEEHGSRPEPLQDREVDDVHEFKLSLAQSVSKSHTKLMLVHISRQLTDIVQKRLTFVLHYVEVVCGIIHYQLMLMGNEQMCNHTVALNIKLSGIKL